MFSRIMAVVCVVPWIVPPEPPATEVVVDQLTQRDARHALTDISWRVSRDSRNMDLTAPTSDADGRVWRMRMNQTHTRLDGWHPLVSIDERRPDRSYAHKSRSGAQFKAYLQSGFEKTAPETIFEERTVVFSKKLRWPDEWGGVDRLLAAGVAMGIRPFSNNLMPIQPANLSVQKDVAQSLDGSRLVVVRETQEDDSYRELWLSGDHDFRPRRWMEIRRDNIVRQLDFEWSEDHPDQLRKWTAQVFHPNSGYHEFADATVVDSSTPLDYENGVFSARWNTANIRTQQVEQGFAVRVRRTLQLLFTWYGVIGMAGFAIAIAVLRSYRRKRSPQE